MTLGYRVCLEHKVSPPEPMIPSISHERSRQEIWIDFFYSKGREYLLITDYFSRFIEVVAMHESKKADAVIYALKKYFLMWNSRES